jgi:DnaA family protein
MMIELPDLKTRINWGLALKLKEFTEPESINALIFKAKRMGFEITPQVSAFLIKHHAKNWESIWILLNKLDEASLSANRKLTLPFLKKILAAD